MNKKYFFVFGVLILLIGIGSSYNVSDYSILDKYATGSYLSGWIEIGFDNETTNTLFEDNFGNQVTLEELLNKTSSYNYVCDNSDCENKYSSTNPETQKQILLGAKQEKVIGLVFYGGIIQDITNFQFNLSSNASESPESQFEIDLLDDGTIDLKNTKTGSTSPETDYSCFESSTQTAAITGTPYCQRFTLDEAPGYLIGAKIQKTGIGNSNLTMTLHDQYGIERADCDLDEEGIDISGKEASCSVDYLINEKEDYFVCISSDQNTGEYRTSFDPTNICGFRGNPPEEEEMTSYSIFVKQKRFGQTGEIEYKNELSNEEDLRDLIYDYLTNKYSRNCPEEGCYVPIKIKSNAQQRITIGDLFVEYDSNSGTDLRINQFQDFSVKYPKISSINQKIILDEIFYLGEEEVKKNYILEFNGDEIIEEEIELEDIEISIIPSIGAIKFPIEYEIITSVKNVSKYEWKLGNSTPVVSNTNKKEYTFEKKGNYTLKVTVINSEDQRFSKSFNIQVGSASELISDKLNQIESKIKALDNQIIYFNEFEKEKVEEELNLTNIKKTFEEIKDLQKNGTEEEVISKLLFLNVPLLIDSSGNKMPYFPKKSLINEGYVEEVSNGQKEDYDLSEAVLTWNQRNVNTFISKNEISSNYDGRIDHLISVFNVDSSLNSISTEEKYYLIIEKIDGLKFSNENLFTEKDNYFVAEISGDVDFYFSTTQDLEVEELPLYFTPVFENLPVLEIDIPEPEDKRMTILFLIFAGLIIIGITVYLVLKRWYTVKYEKYLFKDRNHLFNMVTYINTCKKRNMDNEEIKKNLRKVGWDSEQIRYVMRRYSGKNTGMPRLFSGNKSKTNTKV